MSSEVNNVQQYWEDESSSDERQVAFQVDDDGGEENEVAVPTSAAEYLRMVRRQASRMPNIFCAGTADKSAIPPSTGFAPESSAIANIRLAPMPAFAKPNEQWRQDLLSWFATLQHSLVDNKMKSDADDSKSLPNWSSCSHESWRRLIYDAKHHIEPSVDMVTKMDYMQINDALEALDVCLGNVHPVARDGSVAEESRLDGKRILDDICTGYRSAWLFSLLTNLQLPLQGPTAATLHSILRKLTFARLAVGAPTHEGLATLNVLIIILAQHFGQGETSAFQSTCPPPLRA